MGKRPKSLEVNDAEPPGAAPSQPGAKARTLKRRIQAAAAGASKDRREIILEIAKRRFAQFGYGATTIREIATDAHILSGSIYHHFATKDEILDSIISSTLKYMLHAAQLVEKSDFDAEQKLVFLIRFTLGELTRDKETHAIIWNERIVLRYNPYFEHIAEIRRQIFYAWRGIFIDGTEHDLFRKDLDPFLTISSIIRLLYTAAEWFAIDEQHYNLDEVTDFHLRFILNALRPPGRINETIPETICLDPAALAQARPAGGG